MKESTKQHIQSGVRQDLVLSAVLKKPDQAEGDSSDIEKSIPLQLHSHPFFVDIMQDTVSCS